MPSIDSGASSPLQPDSSKSNPTGLANLQALVAKVSGGSPKSPPAASAQLQLLSSTDTWKEWKPSIQCRATGPANAKLMIVGEAPGEKEAQSGVPFVGASGWLLDQVLLESGLHRAQALVTNVVRERPPGNDIGQWIAEKVKDRTPHHQLIAGKFVLPPIAFGRDLLLKEIAECKPDMVIALGNVAMWALTGNWGIRKWRSSVLQGDAYGHKFKVIPSLHPAAVLREMPLRGLLVHDLRRAAKELKKGPIVSTPDYRFIIRPNYETVIGFLEGLEAQLDTATSEVKLSGDIETRAGHTACLGIAWSKTEAICIPFMCVERLDGYWTLEEEIEIIWRLRRVLAHPKASWTWQNGAYDHQYEYRWHHVLPGMGWDTMLAHHAMFSISPKSLDHLSSLYCEYHRYWKDDGRNWDPSSMPEEQYWTYNCEDCVRTFEIREVEEETITFLAENGWPKLPEVVDFQIKKAQPVITKMMLRGVRDNQQRRAELRIELLRRAAELEQEINFIVGESINVNSPKQLQTFFYETLGCTPIKHRNPDGTWTISCDEEALQTIAGRNPVLRPLVAQMLALRSGLKFLGTYIEMRRDRDGRLRCSYNVGGTKTYRLSSDKNAFGSGGNLQNIPVGDEDNDLILPLPNIRKLFVPDEGKIWFDLDGDSADLRIVTGESGCRAMQAYFEAKAKPYVEIAKEFYRDPTITKHHSSYKQMKALCHGSNYGGEPQGLSDRIGLPVHDIERMQNWYFGMCPEIRAWQEDIKRQGEHRGYIENPFGYRLYNWDRWSKKVANEFLAWTPQSTVGLLVNKIAVAIDEELPWAELLMQVHDSLDGQFDEELDGPAQEEITRVADSIEIPCKSGPIRVPSGLKCSRVSWGDC